MNLQNIKINFLGDSITQGCCATDEHGYVEILTERYGLAAGRNYGIGGTRIARQQIPSLLGPEGGDFCGRFRDMDPDADVVFVFGGTNDHGHGNAPVGDMSDRTPDSFIGACHVLFTGLMETFPNAKIVIATPLHRADESRADGVMLEDYVNHLRAIANHYALPLLDLYASSVINRDTLDRLTTDGLHPNDEGHSILADEIAAFLMNL